MQLTPRWIKAAALAISLPLANTAFADQNQALQSFKAVYASEFDLGVALKGELTRTLTQQADHTWLMTNRAETMVACKFEPLPEIRTTIFLDILQVARKLDLLFAIVGLGDLTNNPRVFAALF
jgi:hypothetical protein